MHRDTGSSARRLHAITLLGAAVLHVVAGASARGQIPTAGGATISAAQVSGYKLCAADPLPAEILAWSTEDQDLWIPARERFHCQYGCYSTDYESDWSSLPTGKETSPQTHWPEMTVETRNYVQWGSQDDDFHLTTGNRFDPITGILINSNFAYFSDRALEVSWERAWDPNDPDYPHNPDGTGHPPEGHATTLINIVGVDYVLIENLDITQDDKGYLAKNTIAISNCHTAIIRNSSFSGTVGHSHIRVDGCRYVFIENVEIAGRVYDTDTLERNGGGITINNCDSKPAKPTDSCPAHDPISCDETCETVREACEGDFRTAGYYAACPNPQPTCEYVRCPEDHRNLEWLVIQNSYIHGYARDDHLNVCPDGSDPPCRNHDGIGVQSPADGIVFNNVIEDWKTLACNKSADAALDVGHRRYCDAEYQDKRFRVERNLFLNNESVKTPGISDATNQILFANNIFLNTLFLDYHLRHDNYLIHNTFVYDGAYRVIGKVFYKLLYNYDDGQTIIGNNLIYVTDPDPNSEWDHFWHMYRSLAEFVREDGGTIYSHSPGFGDLERVVKPDFNLYVGDPTLPWMREEEFIDDYEVEYCTDPDEPGVGKNKEFVEWQTDGKDWSCTGWKLGKDVNSYAFSSLGCMADNTFPTPTPTDFAPTECGGVPDFGDTAYLCVDTAAFRITQDFLGTKRVPPLTVGAIELDAAPVVYVDHEATGRGDGSSWEDAYPTLHQALGAAVVGSGITIRVADGLYTPDETGLADPQEATFLLKNGVRIEGGYGGETILSGDLARDDVEEHPNLNRSDNVYHVVTADQLTEQDVLTHVTIQGGTASGSGIDQNFGGGLLILGGTPIFLDCRFSNNRADCGGGVYARDCQAGFRGCVFEGNGATNGAGAYFTRAGTASTVALAQCEFRLNGAADSGGGLYLDQLDSAELTDVVFDTNRTFGDIPGDGGGGGLYAFSTPLTCTGACCRFEGNEARSRLGGGTGGGLYVDGNGEDPLTLSACDLSSNAASKDGGALAIRDVVGGEVENCVFTDNEAIKGGGALYVTSLTGDSRVAHCTFDDNRSWGSEGGALYSNESTLDVTSSVFTRNQAYFNGGAISFTRGRLLLTNSLLRDNDVRSYGGALYNFNAVTAFVQNCTIVNNHADHLGGGIYNDPANPIMCSVANSILWGNTDRFSTVEEAQLQGEMAFALSSCVQGNTTDWAGSIGDNPLFVDVANNDFRLRCGSPCIDTGRNDLLDSKYDDYDLDDQIRAVDCASAPFDNPCQDNVVDMGAYEFQPERLYVDGEALGDWDDAYTDLQQALTGAQPCSEIWVAASQNGYVPGSSRTSTFQLVDRVALFGGFSGVEVTRNQRDWERNKTVLTCDIDGNDKAGTFGRKRDDNCYHVVTGSGKERTAIVDGFTFQGGHADGSAADRHDRGGGMLTIDGSPTVRHCLLTDNYSSGFGAGMTNRSEGGETSPLIAKCTYLANRSGRGGAGMRNFASTPAIVSCRFLGNEAMGWGGGMNNRDSEIEVTNCIFSGNESERKGGAMSIAGDSKAVITNCTFSRNEALDGEGGGLYMALPATAEVYNSIFWENRDAAGYVEPSQIHLDTVQQITMRRTCVQKLDTLRGGAHHVNFSRDPLFVDPNGGSDGSGSLAVDLRLDSGSPCIDLGENAYLPADMADLDQDCDRAEQLPQDIDGRRRAVTGTAGVVTSGDVDVGAHEWWSFVGSDPGIHDDYPLLNVNGPPDLAAWALIQRCFSGNEGLVTDLECLRADTDRDFDVDLIDVARLSVYPRP